MSPFKWIMSYIKKYKVKMIIGLIITTVTVFMDMVNPFIMGRIADEVFEKANLEALFPLLMLMITITLFKSVIRYIALITYEKVSQNVIFELRQELYKKVQLQSFSFFDNNRVGDIMARMTGDLDAIRHFIAGVIHNMYANILTFVIAIVIMFTISWQTTLVLVIVAPFVFFITQKQSSTIRPYFSRIREQFSRLNSVCQENISGNRVVKAFTREDFEIEKFTKENQAYFDRNVDASEIWMKYLPIQEFLASLMQVFLILFGGILVITGKMEVWKIVTLNGYLWAVNNPMRMFGWLINDIQRFNASLDKIYNMMRQHISVRNPKTSFVAEKIKGDVEFKNVSFSYSGDKNKALNDISFSVKSGDTVGIVGPTGSGKTTLVNMLARFYDVTEGEVLVDGKNVKEYDLHSLRKNIAYSMQDVFLFSNTIEGNLAYGVPEIPMEDLIETAKIASADGFIRETSNGYDTIIGERGVGLSGGQKQRLSLARAIMTDASILVLDDTTSAVDMETEHEIQLAMKEKTAERTTFIIAHRISSVKPADIILVVVEGEIIERGTHDELIEKRGYYYDLFLEQYSDLMEEMEGAKS